MRATQAGNRTFAEIFHRVVALKWIQCYRTDYWACSEECVVMLTPGLMDKLTALRAARKFAA